MCTSCISGFIEYRDYFNQMHCVIACPTGYMAQNGKCFKCIEPCTSCSLSLGKCTSCAPGYFLLNDTNQCVTSCPTSYYVNSSITSCLPCPAQCLTCTLGSCITCKNTYSIPPSCFDTNSCPLNKYLTSTNVCANCDSSCSLCYGPLSTQCISCNTSLVFLDGSCVNTCLSGYYLYKNTTTNLSFCILCSKNIKNC